MDGGSLLQRETFIVSHGTANSRNSNRSGAEAEIGRRRERSRIQVAVHTGIKASAETLQFFAGNQIGAKTVIPIVFTVEPRIDSARDGAHRDAALVSLDGAYAP